MKALTDTKRLRQLVTIHEHMLCILVKKYYIRKVLFVKVELIEIKTKHLLYFILYLFYII